MSHNNSRYPPRGGGGGGHRQSSGRDYRDRDRGDYRDNHRDNNRDRYPPRRDFGTSSRNSSDAAFPRSDSYSDRNRFDSHTSVFSPRHQAPPPPSYDAPPPPPPPGADRYQMPQSDFSFRVDKPAGVQEADSYRPDQNGRRRRDERSNRGPYSSRNNNGARPSRGGRPYEGKKPWRPFVAAERELLQTNHDTGDAEVFFDENAGLTFRNLDEISDSEEAEMDISGDEREDDSAEPSQKRARFSAVRSTAEDSTPKWSNPDPYTALPPETATDRKKKDVVQMIRKARVQSKEIKKSLSETADFIALDFDDSGSDDDIFIVNDSAAPVPPLAPAPVVAAAVDGDSASKRIKVPSLMPDPALGSRKRTHDDRIKAPHIALKKGTKPPSVGHIVEEWRRVPGLTSTPWVRGDHFQAKNPLVSLHKEIVDFYDYIRPRDFEQHLRAELVQDMKKFIKKTYKDADIHAFGSFPSGLYLPTGDMDLVMLSEKFVNRGIPMYHTTSALFRFRDRLNDNQIPYRGDVELITKARVPLCKYIDRKTGLKVDVSFENSTGLDAINTFLGWKKQYPGMPMLVTLVKHYLMMRGLNEPVNGGIGGFSVICLVVSMLQLSPEVQSGALNTTHHLGELLMRFFDLYGNQFDYQNIAIRLSPPGYIEKDNVRQFTYKQYNRFSIIDPNNPENDIAGGSSNTATVVASFSKAHQDLRRRMKHIAEDPKRKNESILDVLLGGNYTSFQEQRDYLEKLVVRTDIVPDYDPVPTPQGRGGSWGGHNSRSNNRNSRGSKRGRR